MPKTRDSVVKEMEAAIAVSYPLVQSGPKPRLIWWLEHQAEQLTMSRIHKCHDNNGMDGWRQPG